MAELQPANLLEQHDGWHIAQDWAACIRGLRILTGITQDIFGTHFGVVQQTVDRWEHGGTFTRTMRQSFRNKLRLTQEDAAALDDGTFTGKPENLIYVVPGEAFKVTDDVMGHRAQEVYGLLTTRVGNPDGPGLSVGEASLLAALCGLELPVTIEVAETTTPLA